MRGNGVQKKGRPLSFPSSLDSFPETVSPTSPIETTCCRCKRSKSVGALFPPGGGAPRNQKGHWRFPKLTWSVFRRRHSSDRTVSLRGPGSSQHLFKNSKPTSWTFVHKDDRSARDRAPELPPLPAKQRFVITPKSSPLMQTAKPNLSDDRRSSAPMSLRKHVLTKDISSPALPPKKRDVPRSPGPLDGSPYAQVVKNKRGGSDSSEEELNKAKRLYHSADELSETATLPMQTTIERKSVSGSNIQDANDSENAAPPADQSRLENSWNENETSESFLPPVTSQPLSSVDLLRDVTSVSSTSVTQTEDQSGSLSTSAETSTQIMTSPENVDVTSRTTVVVVTSQVDVHTTTGDASDTESDVNARSEHAEVVARDEKVDDVTASSEDLTADGAAQDDGNNCDQSGDSLAANFGDADDMSASTTMTVVMPELRPNTSGHLTQQQVHEAMALVNECLADHESRSVVSDGNDLLDEPHFPTPQEPDYPALEPDPSRFAEKGPEYALPVRDVVLSSVPARKAILVTSPSSVQVTSSAEFPSIERQIDDAVSQLMVSDGEAQPHRAHYVVTDDAQRAQTVESDYKSSFESGHSLGGGSYHVTNAAGVSTTTYSDADSGIGGSSTNAYDVKPSPTLDRITFANPATSSFHGDVTRENHPSTGQLEETRKERALTGSDNDTSAPSFPETVVHYIPAPKEAEIHVITIRNVFTDSHKMSALPPAQQPQATPSVFEAVPQTVEDGSSTTRDSPPPCEATTSRRSAPIPYRIEQSPKRIEVQHQTSEEQPVQDPGPASQKDRDETEEERRVREEIEDTQRKLLWLQEQQNKIKKKKEGSLKRHSFGYTPTPQPVEKEQAPTHVISATLPRRPVHHVINHDQSQPAASTTGITDKEKHDIDELLRSVQDLDLPSARNEATKRNKQTDNMATTAMPPDQAQRYPHFHETSPGFKVADPRVAQRAAVFTPAYAHPMHQPTQMERHPPQVGNATAQLSPTEWQQPSPTEWQHPRQHRAESLQDQQRRQQAELEQQQLHEQRLLQQQRQQEWQQQQRRIEDMQQQQKWQREQDRQEELQKQQERIEWERQEELRLRQEWELQQKQQDELRKQQERQEWERQQKRQEELRLRQEWELQQKQQDELRKQQERQEWERQQKRQEELRQQQARQEWEQQQKRQEELRRQQEGQEWERQQKQQEELRRQQERQEWERQQKQQEEFRQQQKRQEEWQLQQEEHAKLRRKQMREEERNLWLHQMEQERVQQQKRERQYVEQEEKRARERELQEQFQREFENKQQILRKDNPPQRDEPLITEKALQQQKLRLTSSRSSPPSSVTSPPQEQPTSADRKAELTEDLQLQLDELDRYIAQLSNVGDAPVPEATPSKPDVVLRRRRSLSMEVERRTGPNTKLTAKESASPISTALSPPRPPSRTRSSFDSVSRRLSHGFELAQAMRQTSIEQDVRSAKDDDVFSPPPVAPQPSYPPKSSLTRPHQQQIVTRPLITVQQAPPPAQKKVGQLEDNLSPQLFLAMSVNPGARPVEDIHSFKEDLDPDKEDASDQADSAPPLTPGFPMLPASPTNLYFNNTSPTGSGQQHHVPFGLAKTPLSALGLKPKEQPESAINEAPEEVRSHLDSAPKQHVTTTSQGATMPAGFANGYSLSASTTSSPTMAKETSLLSTNPRLEAQPQPVGNHSMRPANPSANDNIHGTLVSSSGVRTYSGSDDTFTSHKGPSNGWANQRPGNGSVKTHILSNGGSASLTTMPDRRSPGVSPLGTSLTPPAFGSGGVSPSGTRSLTGSNDSLLSDGSASGINQSRYGHPPLPPKESSRLSGSSIRSSSTGGSGYLGGTSQTSPHSAGSPISGSGQYPFTSPINKRESQMSAYDRHLAPGHHGLSSGDEGSLNSPASGRTSSSSVSDVEKLAHELAHSGLNGNSPPKFIRDTTSYWFKPDINREEALAMLRHQPAGSFVVRESRCYPGAFGLALKVNEVPAAVLATVKPGTDINNELVRHFLIEPSSRGVKLKGCANEPVFGSLSALIYQHSITPLALPCKLIIPAENMEIRSRPGSVRGSQEISNSAAELLRQGAACNVLYLGSANTESLTGPEAIERAMREVTQTDGQAVKTSVVHFKVSPQGITLTDNARKIFFRRHYPTANLTFCGMDPSAREPHNRRWDATAQKGPSSARVFGFVAKKPGVAENSCHLFAELDKDQPAPAVVNFVSKVLMGSTHN